MNKTVMLAAFSLTALLSGCASGPDTMTQTNQAADCKVQPMRTASPSYGKQKPVTELDRSQAVADLSRSEARLNALRGPLGQSGLYEELLRDCR